MTKAIQTTLVLLLGWCGVKGQYQIGHFSKTFVDASRNRNIPTEVYYPVDGSGNPAQGSFPVIIFGHGFVMSYSAYENLWETWVPEGYIMAFPTTEGSLFPTPSHTAFGADLRYLVDAIQGENSNSSSDLWGIVGSNTALMGHSMGGGCSFLAASNNSNIQTVIGLAPAETNPSAVSAGGSISVPVLILSGSADGVTPPADHHEPIYDAAGAACKAFVSIEGGGHCYFANSNFNCDFGESTSSAGITISRATQQAITYEWVTPWLDYHLKGDCEAFALFSDKITDNNLIAVTAQHSCPLQTIPDIHWQGGILSTSTAGNSYQWMQGGVALSGADQMSYTPSQSGNYSVLVMYDNGCSRLSDSLAVSVQPVGIDMGAGTTVKGNVYVHAGHLYWQDLRAEEGGLRVYDINGRLLAAYTIDANSGRVPLYGEGGVYIVAQGGGHWVVGW